MRLGGAGYGLTSRIAAAAMAGYGLAWPRGCGHWLPVRLPRTSLAALTSGRPRASRPDRPDSARSSRPLSSHIGRLRAGMRPHNRRGAVPPWRTAEISSTWSSSPAATCGRCWRDARQIANGSGS